MSDSASRTDGLGAVLRRKDRLGRRHDRAEDGKSEKEDEGLSPHPYLMTASVLVSKKWIRSGTKASRIFSCVRALTLGSTRATTD